MAHVPQLPRRVFIQLYACTGTPEAWYIGRIGWQWGGVGGQSFGPSAPCSSVVSGSGVRVHCAVQCTVPGLLLTVATSRYEYDDHYFLTDPKEFIYEFFPLQPEWQLLKEPINLEEFEELPFVRSLFFRYQLAFPTQYMKSVMSTDQTGENFGLNSCPT